MSVSYTHLDVYKRQLQRVVESRLTAVLLCLINTSQRLVDLEKNVKIVSMVPKNVTQDTFCANECWPHKLIE